MISDERILELTQLDEARVRSLENKSLFGRHLWNYYQFISWSRWFPDLFVEIFKNKESNRQLHFDQRVFMRCDLRFMSMYGTFSRGYAKCIKGDSLIYTDEGIKEIGEFFDYKNDGCETHYNTKVSLVNRYGDVEKTKLGLYNGKQNCITITTDDGFSLTGTEIHKVLIINTNGDIMFKPLKQIQNGDYVLINRKNNLWGGNTDIDVSIRLNKYLLFCSKQESSHLNIRKLPVQLNEDIAKVFGYLIGDGCMTLERSIIFTNIGDELLENYKVIMFKYFGVTEIKRVNKYDYKINDKYLRKYLEFQGFSYVDAKQKEIPKCILSSPQNIMSSFLLGLFDTDGTVDDKVVSLSTVSYKLAKQVQFILLNYGIISRFKKTKTNQGLRYCYKIIISGNDVCLFKSHIGFELKYKQKRLIRLCDKIHNTNKDIIPFQNNTVKKLLDNSCLNSVEIKPFYHIIHGDNNLSYSKLCKLLSLNSIDKSSIEYNKLIQLYNLNYYYSRVTDVNHSYEDVYDFHLAETHSFISNGLISHNTYTEVLDDFIAAILFPGITLSVTAQTRENSAALLEDKYNEIISDFPLLENEIEKSRFSKNDAFIKFKSSSVITNLANAQTSKGRRRHRIKIEESALLNNTLYEDALEPIVEVPRTTAGSLAIVDPEEMNFQIHFFTTSGYRGSDEYNRSVRMVNGMRNCSGDIVLGSGWMLPCYYGRGSTKSQILKKKKRSNPIFFAQNYEQKWVGCSDGALVDINKLMACRVLEEPITEIQNDNDEFYIGVDVARSENTNNNQSAISVIKVIRNKGTKRITSLQVVNVYGMSNKLNFTEQACVIKKYKRAYKAKVVIADGNGLGSGLVDELLKPSYDKITGKYLGCFDTINTDNQPQSTDAEQCLFDMKAQTYQTKVVSHFINAVDSGLLKMLIRKQEQDFNDKEREFFDKNVAPFINSELLFFEITNLKLKVSGKNLSVEKVVRKIDKDRFSATAYGIFYILEFCNKDTEEEKFDYHSAPSCVSSFSYDF